MEDISKETRGVKRAPKIPAIGEISPQGKKALGMGSMKKEPKLPNLGPDM